MAEEVARQLACWARQACAHPDCSLPSACLTCASSTMATSALDKKVAPSMPGPKFPCSVSSWSASMKRVSTAAMALAVAARWVRKLMLLQAEKGASSFVWIARRGLQLQPLVPRAVSAMWLGEHTVRRALHPAVRSPRMAMCHFGKNKLTHWVYLVDCAGFLAMLCRNSQELWRRGTCQPCIQEGCHCQPRAPVARSTAQAFSGRKAQGSSFRVAEKAPWHPSVTSSSRRSS